MTLSDPLLTHLCDPRLASHALGTSPAWLWSADATRVLWANAAGAAVLGAAGPHALAERRMSAAQPLAAQVLRLAGTLPYGGAPRLERLRIGGPGTGRPIACTCSRLALANGTPAILVAATEAVGPALPLAERTARLFAGCQAPVAAFAADGTLLYATPAAAARLGDDVTSIEGLGAEPLVAQARAAGRASGESAFGPVTVERIGSGTATVLIVLFADEPLVTSPRLRGEVHRRPPAAILDEKNADALHRLWRSASGEGDPPNAQPAESPPHPDPLPASGEREPARRHPLRFVWQVAPDGRFTVGSDEFARAMGPRTVALVGHPWREIAATLALDPEGRVEQAIASRDTFSGIHVAWPVDGADARVEVELSGLPTFDRDRVFRGYRGFGVCRDVARIITVVAAERLPPATPVAAPPPEKPLLTVVPAAKNVVPFRAAPAAPDKRPALSPVERTNFREIAKVLGAGPDGEDATMPGEVASGSASQEPGLETAAERPADPAMPAGTPGPVAEPAADSAGAIRDRLVDAERALRASEAENRELKSILDTATDGVVVIGRDGCINSLSRSAEALFGRDAGDLTGRPFVDLFAPESQRVAGDYLDGLTRDGVATLLNDGREVIGRARRGGLVPLFMTLGRIGEDGDKFCAVLRDLTSWKRAEEELLESKRRAERASAAKSDFLAKISHEIRTPLNTVLGFSEVMMEERFGPIDNERYRQYLKDIHASGGHLVSLINDLLDLSKIEAGKLDLTFAKVDLNGLVQQCVALMQPQANRERIIIRTSLAPGLPPVMVDARSIRQIALNLLSNSIKFTGAGGQVIVSTALTDRGEAVLRVRDTGAGMSEKEIEAALEPFRQLATSTRWGSGGTGLGLPLTKALAEANRASFAIKSAVNAGTLVEITFPAARVPAA
jgi:PAS domain S-box-containing protein